MPELEFNEKLCKECETIDCLTECQYMDVDRDTAKSEIMKVINGEDSFALEECATCYACEEYCPYDNHPFYLITERREEKDILTAARPITKQWINMSAMQGKYMVGDIGEKTLSYCGVPKLMDMANGKLFEDIESSFIIGAEFMCQVVYLHFAKPSIIKERLPKVIENIEDAGVEKLICLHDECYGSFTSLAPAYGIEVPFEPIHYYDYLLEKLDELEDDITSLDYRVAYQRPCSSRLSPDKHPLAEKIFDKIGVELVDREYQDENALCCGEVPRMIFGLEFGDDIQKRNIDDMVDKEAEYCMFNCPFCQRALSEKVSKREIEPIHIIELCKKAIGEE